MIRAIWLAIVGVGGWRYGQNQNRRNMGMPPNRRRYPGRIGVAFLFLIAIIGILILPTASNSEATLIFLAAVGIWLGLRHRRKNLERQIEAKQFEIWDRNNRYPRIKGGLERGRGATQTSPDSRTSAAADKRASARGTGARIAAQPRAAQIGTGPYQQRAA
ncbi:MAG: hypothetical protein ACREKE_05655 [bacterium]